MADGVKKNPWQDAGVISKLLHTWIIPLLYTGNKINLDVDDLYKCAETYKSEFLTVKLEKQWAKELEKHNKGLCPSLISAVLRTFKGDLIRLFLIVLFQNCMFRICQSLFIGSIVFYFSNPEASNFNYYLSSIVGLWASSTIYSFLANLALSYGSFIGTKMRVACTQLLYKKIVKLRVEKTNDTESGKIVNMIANSMNRFELGCRFCAYTLVAPLQLMLSGVFLWRMVGMSTLAGTGIFVLQFIFQVFFGKVMTKLRKKTAKLTDERVRIVNEIFSAIRVIKMYTYESPLFEELKKIRAMEVSQKLFASILNGVISDGSHIFGKLGVFVSTAVVFGLTQRPFKDYHLFMATSFFENLRLSGRLFAFAISYQADMYSCLKRLQAILLTECPCNTRYLYSLQTKGDLAISAKNMTSTWIPNSDKPALKNISLDIKKGELVAVVGPIGAGKTTLLMAIMGELQQTEGSLCVEGKLAYVPQEPWLINRNVRDNVMIFSSFTDTQYQEALVVTTLDKDIINMEFKDKTPVGEKGSLLSGGQKARVNLCRALCSNSDVYLLDDPLSAVDASVGRKLFENCICGYLKDKTRILVTHQVHFLKTVDKILVLEKGRFVAYGSYNDLKNSNLDLGSLVRKDRKEKEKSTKVDIQLDTVVRERTTAVPLELLDSNYQTLADALRDEDNSGPSKPEPELSNSSTQSTFFKYCSAGGVLFLLLPILVAFTAQTFFTMIDVFTSSWSAKHHCWPGHASFNDSLITKFKYEYPNATFELKCPIYTYLMTTQGSYFLTYVVLISGLVFTWMLRSCLFHLFCNNAARYLHKKAVTSLFAAPISFFDCNPMGRILNRITKDVGNIDDVLPVMFSECCLLLLMQLGYVVIVIFYLPYMALLSFFLLFGCFAFGKFYLKPGRDLQRLEATTSSPVYSMVSCTLKGLPLMRAYRGQEKFIRVFCGLQDIQTSAAICNSCAGSFYRTSVELCAMFFISAIYLMISLFPDIDAQSSGIVLNSSTQMGLAIQYISLLMLQIVTLMVSVERVWDYKKLQREESSFFPGRQPSPSWPQKGEIKFTDVSLSYNPGAYPSLKNLCFTINPGEKVGIVGRTGAGKSSIISAMMRLHEPSGTIDIDGMRTSDLNLKVLRSRISVIPQEPVLFTGTLRKSLDPFTQFPDCQIWAALKTVHLEEEVRQHPTGLNYFLTDGGSNFSIGQRQLLCLARAILLKNKILILDEASASLDFESDALIQTAIRHNFRDCTTMTVAHRLDTIIDCDKVLVLNKGELIEYDEPYTLLRNPSGAFASLVQQTGSIQAASLWERAEMAHENRSRRQISSHDLEFLTIDPDELIFSNAALQMKAL